MTLFGPFSTTKLNRMNFVEHSQNHAKSVGTSIICSENVYMGDFREFHLVISVRKMSLFVVFEIETMLYVRIVASRFQVSLKYRC